MYYIYVYINSSLFTVVYSGSGGHTYTLLQCLHNHTKKPPVAVAVVFFMNDFIIFASIQSSQSIPRSTASSKCVHPTWASRPGGGRPGTAWRAAQSRCSRSITSIPIWPSFPQIPRLLRALQHSASKGDTLLEAAPENTEQSIWIFELYSLCVDRCDTSAHCHLLSLPVEGEQDPFCDQPLCWVCAAHDTRSAALVLFTSKNWKRAAWRAQ